MKPIKRLGKVKIPKTWEVVGRKKLKKFFSIYPYLKLWYCHKIERINTEWWKEKSKINALYIAGFLTKDEKRYSFLLENWKLLSKNGIILSERFIGEEETGH